MNKHTQFYTEQAMRPVVGGYAKKTKQIPVDRKLLRFFCFYANVRKTSNVMKEIKKEYRRYTRSYMRLQTVVRQYPVEIDQLLTKYKE